MREAIVLIEFNFFQIEREIYYVEWRDKLNEMIFDDPGPGNYSCALMVGIVPENKEEEKPPAPEKAPGPVEKLSRQQKLHNRDKLNKKKGQKGVRVTKIV